MLCSMSRTDRFKAVIFHQGRVCLCGGFFSENPPAPPNQGLKSRYFNTWLNQDHPFSQTRISLVVQFFFACGWRCDWRNSSAQAVLAEILGCFRVRGGPWRRQRYGSCAASNSQNDLRLRVSYSHTSGCNRD